MLITRENINNGSKMPKMRVIPLVVGGTMLTDGRSVVADFVAQTTADDLFGGPSGSPVRSRSRFADGRKARLDKHMLC